MKRGLVRTTFMKEVEFRGIYETLCICTGFVVACRMSCDAFCSSQCLVFGCFLQCSAVFAFDFDFVITLHSILDCNDFPAEEDTNAAQMRSDIFGRSSWGGGMSCMLWAIEENSLAVCKPPQRDILFSSQFFLNKTSPTLLRY